MINSVPGHRSALNHLAPWRNGVPLGRTATHSSADDWHVTAVIFALIGGLAALWIFDLSLVSGGLAAMLSAVAGLLFANG